jgi:Haem-binding domain
MIVSCSTREGLTCPGELSNRNNGKTKNIAPISWLIQHDVDDARQHLNFSEWDKPQSNAPNAADQVQSGAMPKSRYLLLHTAANLTPTEKDALIQGLIASLGSK